jgi:hypothetical protein
MIKSHIIHDGFSFVLLLNSNLNPIGPIPITIIITINNNVLLSFIYKGLNPETDDILNINAISNNDNMSNPKKFTIDILMPFITLEKNYSIFILNFFY